MSVVVLCVAITVNDEVVPEREQEEEEEEESAIGVVDVSVPDTSTAV